MNIINVEQFHADSGHESEPVYALAITLSNGAKVIIECYDADEDTGIEVSVQKTPEAGGKQIHDQRLLVSRTEMEE